jgi:hypothetical protein
VRMGFQEFARLNLAEDLLLEIRAGISPEV